jgi:hypothetical protein
MKLGFSVSVIEDQRSVAEITELLQANLLDEGWYANL